MAKLFGLALMCLGIWIAMEIYLEGTQNAFGGALVSFSGGSNTQRDTRSTPQRAGDATRRAHSEAADRLENALPE